MTHLDLDHIQLSRTPASQRPLASDQAGDSDPSPAVRLWRARPTRSDEGWMVNEGQSFKVFHKG